MKLAFTGVLSNTIAVILGIALIILGNMPKLVGHGGMHTFLIFVGGVMVICAGFSLIMDIEISKGDDDD